MSFVSIADCWVVHSITNVKSPQDMRSFYENLPDLVHSVPKILQQQQQSDRPPSGGGGGEDKTVEGEGELDDEVDIEEVLKQDGLEDVEQV